MSALVDVGKLEELRFLLVEEVREVIYAFLELMVEFGAVQALIEVRDDDSLSVLDR